MENRERARQAVREEMTRQRITSADLARDTGLDYATVRDFVAGDRWPRSGTLAKIDEALNWTHGTLERIGRGLPLSDADVDQATVGVLLDIAPDAYGDLSETERQEAAAAATASYLAKAREIRRQREG